MVSATAFSGLRFIGVPICDCCGFPFDLAYSAREGGQCGSCLRKAPPYSTARAALVYDDASRDLILRFKHADQIDMVHCFVPWLMRAGQAQIETADVIVPVPLHFSRLLRRRYNQAALIAAALSKAAGKAYMPDGLLRQRATPTQGRLNYKERKKNVRQAFVVNPKQAASLAGKKVLLVDDVYTTGATVKECTRALLAAGVAEVSVLAVARVVRPQNDY